MIALLVPLQNSWLKQDLHFCCVKILAFRKLAQSRIQEEGYFSFSLLSVNMNTNVHSSHGFLSYNSIPVTDLQGELVSASYSKNIKTRLSHLQNDTLLGFSRDFCFTLGNSDLDLLQVRGCLDPEFLISPPQEEELAKILKSRSHQMS